MMFISHYSCYSAWFRRHRSRIHILQLRQKLSPSCVLVLWLKHTSEKCRNAVKMKVWFIHLACHSKLLMLAGRGFTLSAFPRLQHLCIHLSNALNWRVCALVLHRPLTLHPCKQTRILCQDPWLQCQTHWLTQTEPAESVEAPDSGTSARRQRWTSKDGGAGSQLWTQNSERNLHNNDN